MEQYQDTEIILSNCTLYKKVVFIFFLKKEGVYIRSRLFAVLESDLQTGEMHLSIQRLFVLANTQRLFSKSCPFCHCFL